MVPDFDLTLTHQLLAALAAIYLIPAFAIAVMAGLYGR